MATCFDRPDSRRGGLLASITPGRAFALVLALAVAFRLALALSYPHMWGVDGGASGETVNYWLGRVDFWNGFPKPPLAPGWLLAPFWTLLGPDSGYKVWSALFSALPLVPVFLLARRYAGGWPAVAAVAFAAVDLTWGAMFVTGAHPLVGFALLGMVWWCLDGLATSFRAKYAILLVFSLGLIPWTNQTAAALALITLPVLYLVMLACTTGKAAFLRRTVLPVVVGGVLAAAALPWYLQTLPGSSILTYGGPTLFWAFDWPVFQAAFISFPLGLFALWQTPRASMRGVGATLLVLGVMVQFMSFDEVIINPLYRARYLTALAFYPLMAWVVWTYCIPAVRRWASPRVALGRWVIYGGAAAALVYMSVGFVYTVRLQNEYSLMVTQDTAQALAHLREKDPEANVATNAFTLSLWVSALNRVRSPFAFTAPPPPAYVEDDKHLRCLYNWVEGCDPAEAAAALDVDYLLVEERFPYYNDRAPGNYLAPPDQWQRTADADWLMLQYKRGTTELWAIVPYTGTGPVPTATPHATSPGP